jgi:50S ribosomal subunit-associated GTPase HflX
VIVCTHSCKLATAMVPAKPGAVHCAQVRMAAASYQMPRLRRMWTHLERQSGAGSTRGGMGEAQKEVDKRLLRRAVPLASPLD